MHGIPAWALLLSDCRFSACCLQYVVAVVSRFKHTGTGLGSGKCHQQSKAKLCWRSKRLKLTFHVEGGECHGVISQLAEGEEERYFQDIAEWGKSEVWHL